MSISFDKSNDTVHVSRVLDFYSVVGIGAQNASVVTRDCLVQQGPHNGQRYVLAGSATAFSLHWLELVAQPMQEGKIGLLQQQSGIVVDIVVEIQNGAVSIRFICVVVVIATVHKILHDPLCDALLIFVVDNVGRRRGGCCHRCHRCRRRGVRQLDIVVLGSKQQIWYFGVDVGVVKR